MRDLAIAYGNNRQAKKWINKTTKYEDLKERLKVTIRTTESAEEYARMSKAQRDAAKDHGGFVGGVLAGGRRKVDTVESRSMIALDGDRIDTDFLDNYETNAPYTSFLYTTHSHTPDNPRVRLIFPLTRDITAEEFVAVSRYLAQMLGIDFFDECSYQPNQLMYWPSSPQNGVFVFKEVEKDWLNPDDILNAHPEWTDPTRLPTSSRESKANQITQQKVQDPLTKEGTVGLFNRVFFPVTRALDTFLSDIYEATDNENRYHLIAASSMAGVEIKDDKFVYSHHAKDPAYLKLCNAFDIVRIHNRIGLGYFRPMIAVSLIPRLGYSKEDRVALFKAAERFIFINFRMAMYQSSYKSSDYYRKTREVYTGSMTLSEVTADLNETTDANAKDAVRVFLTRMNRRFISADGFYSWRDLRYFLYEYEYSLATKYKLEKLSWALLTKVVKDRITVEHILPQTPTKLYWRNNFRQFTDAEIKALSSSLGNMLPLSQSINSSLQNDSFDDKKARGYANLAMHIGRTRYMKCPECGKWSWQKKFLSKEDEEV